MFHGKDQSGDCVRFCRMTGKVSLGIQGLNRVVVVIELNSLTRSIEFLPAIQTIASSLGFVIIIGARSQQYLKHNVVAKISLRCKLSLSYLVQLHATQQERKTYDSRNIRVRGRYSTTGTVFVVGWTTDGEAGYFEPLHQRHQETDFHQGRERT